MADTRVNVKDASAATVPIDGFTQSDGDVRQAFGVGDAAGAQTQMVDTQGRAAVAASGLSVATPTSVAMTAGTIYEVAVNAGGNITFWIEGTNTATTAAVTLGNIVFEQSDDRVNWAGMSVVRSDNNVVVQSVSGGTIAAGAALALDGPLEGINYVRARAVTSASSGTQYLHAVVGGMPFSPVVSVAAGSITSTAPGITKGTQATTGYTVQPLRDAGRTNVGLLIDAVAASAATTETLASYGGNNGATALTAGTGAFTVPSGKTFRITSMTVTATGTAAGSIRVRLRASASTTGPLLAGAHVIVPAASGGDTVAVPIPDGIELAAGTVLGISFFASATTITYSVFVTGFYY